MVCCRRPQTCDLARPCRPGKSSSRALMKFLRTHSLVGSLCATLRVTAFAPAEVKPAALFSDHMVLQSGMAAPIWGTADPSEKVAVSLNGKTVSATADANGKWTVRLAKLKAGGPFEMTIDR